MEYLNIWTDLNSNTECTAVVLKAYKCSFQYVCEIHSNSY